MCDLCKAREILSKVSKLLDEIPLINSAFYDDVISDLSNDVCNASSTFQCTCEDLTNKAQA